ncbi:MAG: MFS transporter [Beijerinckiaceae bacterium]|nr:MFS transporter [Beijerinckiaceae bacterium]
MIRTEYWKNWLAAFLFFAAFYALLVPFPLYLAQCGLSDWQVGAILGAFGIATLVGRPLAGFVADRWGPRRVICFGTVVLVVGAAAAPLTESAVLLFGLRIAQALGYAAFTTAATMRVAESVVSERRGTGLAVFGVSVNLAMTITPMLVTVWLDTLTLHGAMWLAAGIGLGAGALSVWVNDAATQSRSVMPWRMAFKPPAILRYPMLAALVLGVGFGTFLQFLPILSQRRDLLSAGHGYATYGVAIIATRLATATWQDRCDRRYLLWPAFLCLAAGLCFLAMAGTPIAVLVGAGLVAVGSGVLHPGLIATAVDLMPEAERGRAISNIYLSFDLGIGIGAWALTPAFEWFGAEGLFLAAGAICGAGLLVVPWFPSQTVFENLKLKKQKA